MFVPLVLLVFLPPCQTFCRYATSIRRTSLPIHDYLRSGHLEKVYENALVHRLRKQGLEVTQQIPIECL